MDLFQNIFNSPQTIYISRMILAAMCGVCIGWERKNRAKEAGLRTHCIVACGSALIMLVSKYGFLDVGADGSRVAAQIVSGIGFLGAGMIFVHKSTITGLTTAAGVWTTAGIGMAMGAGMYSLGIVATIVVLIIQILLHRNSRFTKTSKLMILSVRSDGEPEFQKRLYKHLEAMDIHIYSADVSNNTDEEYMSYRLTVDLPPDLNEERIVAEYENSRLTPCK